jgi:hypothetical protein
MIEQLEEMMMAMMGETKAKTDRKNRKNANAE